MTAVAVPLRRIQAGWRIDALPRSTPGRLSFLIYLAIGLYLAAILHAYHGDAYSRVANAYYVLFSRDPHLAALGFVWTPLPSLFELVFLPAKLIWPGIAQLALPAVLMSATFMALAVREVDLILGDFGLRRAMRLGLAGAFALHPAIVYYGAIGTSEAPTLFFALLACRNLLRYVGSTSGVVPPTASLVGVGIALAGAFLTRYEAVPAALGVAGAIILLALLRQPGAIRKRLGRGGADVAVALTPFVLVFVGWSLISWIIVGSPFTQFTSDYGNSSQMRVWAAAGANEIGLPLGPSIVLAGLRLGALSVVAPIALLGALGLLVARRDYRVLAIGAVIGPLLAFMVLAYLLHLLAPWLRYFISVVPLGILLLGLVIAPHAGSEQAPSRSERADAAHRDPFVSQPESVAPWRRHWRAMPARSSALSIAALGLALVSVPIAAAGMLDRTVAVEESRDIGAILGPQAGAADRPGAAVRTFAGERTVAAYLDSMSLPRGVVLMDVFSAFPIVLWSDHPEQFVITTDHDFKQALADPYTFGVRYLLVPSTEGNGVVDAVNRAYPDLALQHGFATIVQTFPAIGTSATWSLFRLEAP